MSIAKDQNTPNQKNHLVTNSNLKNFVTIDTNTSAHNMNTNLRKESDFSSKSSYNSFS